MVTLTAAILLFIHAWKNGKKPNGVNSACYFIVYGGVRSIMEPLRDGEFILNGGGVPWSLVMSICMFVGGVVWLALLLYFNKKKEGAWIGSVNGDPYGITKFLGDTPTEVAYLDNVNMMCAVYPENYAKKPEGENQVETSEETQTEEDVAQEKTTQEEQDVEK
jgi:hypothetical protein